MKLFQCDHCFAPIFFENTQCESCGSALGYLSGENRMVALALDDVGWHSVRLPEQRFRYCDNQQHQACNWLILEPSEALQCSACELNGTIPNLETPDNLLAWQTLEQAKHRLVYSLLQFDLPLQSKVENPELGLEFDFLEPILDDPEHAVVYTGHANGLITLNINEADPVHREQMRQQMGEPYRTLIGHFRHEVGHYYWELLVRDNPEVLLRYRALFGDERADYGETMARYYQSGAPVSWPAHFISAYAASHPWEDWAESWAHYMHLLDTVETGRSFGVSLQPQLEQQEGLAAQLNFDPYREPDFDRLLNAGVALTLAINSINRSMGQPDLYPFVLCAPAVEKLRFIHQLLVSAPIPEPENSNPAV